MESFDFGKWLDEMERQERIRFFLERRGADWVSAMTQPKGEMRKPEDWTADLEQMGIARGSPEWWNMIEKWVRSHWARYGRQSLPVSSSNRGRITLETITCYSRKTIYEKTLLGEKEVTEDDTK